jgi:hypothetical protein
LAEQSNYYSAANDTKWRELRAAMLDLDNAVRPKFRCKSLECSQVDQWDGEWFYHWLEIGWDRIEWVELSAKEALRRDVVRAILKRIRFAGEETAEGFRIYGYLRNGEAADYLE